MRSPGAAWLRAYGKTVSPEGERVAELVDWLFDGIYHQQDAVAKADWSGRYVRLAIPGGMATYDNSLLTRLVVGAHDRAIRVEIGPCNFHHLELMFHPRTRGGERIFQRHPTMGEALDRMNRQPPYADQEGADHA